MLKIYACETREDEEPYFCRREKGMGSGPQEAALTREICPLQDTRMKKYNTGSFQRKIFIMGFIPGRKTYMKKRIATVSVVLASTLAMAVCGQAGADQSKGAPAPESELQTAAEAESSAASSEQQDDGGWQAAQAAYGSILDQAASLDFQDGDWPADTELTYSYALDYMQDGALPQLLVQKDEMSAQQGGFDYVRVFNYNTETGALEQPSTVITTGVAGVGGFRAGMVSGGYGNGLVFSTWYSMSGEADYTRYIYGADELLTEDLGQGMIDSTPTYEGAENEQEIVWTDISDRSVLQNPDPQQAASLSLQAEETMDDQADVYADSQADGTTDSQASGSGDLTTAIAEAQAAGNIVATGTVSRMTQDQLLAVQGVSNPNPGVVTPDMNIMVLSAPQEMGIPSADGDFYTDEVHLLRLPDTFDVTTYAGQTITISFAPSDAIWPSDTSLPLGEPRVDNCTVLG